MRLTGGQGEDVEKESRAETKGRQRHDGGGKGAEGARNIGFCSASVLGLNPSSVTLNLINLLTREKIFWGRSVLIYKRLTHT